MARTIRHAIAGIVLLLCAAQTAMSCSVRSMELKRVPQDLAVSITHDKVPIAGIEVKVVKKNTTDPVFTGVTDEHGAVVIHGLAAGQYTLTASHLGFSAGEEWIEVVTGSDEKLQGHFSFEWNSDFQTSRIAGTLSGRIPGNTGHPLMDIIHPRETVFGVWGSLFGTLSASRNTGRFQTALVVLKWTTCRTVFTSSRLLGV